MIHFVLDTYFVQMRAPNIPLIKFSLFKIFFFYFKRNLKRTTKKPFKNTFKVIGNKIEYQLCFGVY